MGGGLAGWGDRQCEAGAQRTARSAQPWGAADSTRCDPGALCRYRLKHVEGADGFVSMRRCGWLGACWGCAGGLLPASAPAHSPLPPQPAPPTTHPPAHTLPVYTHRPGPAAEPGAGAQKASQQKRPVDYAFLAAAALTTVGMGVGKTGGRPARAGCLHISLSPGCC